LGLLMAGWDVRVAVEYDKWAAETYRYNHKKTVLLEQDITTLKGWDILVKARINKGDLDLLAGGPPCQGFATVNPKRSVTDPRSKLMWEFIRMTKELEPKYFMIENVPGLLSFKDFFILLMKALEDTGYVVRCLMMDAVDYGVPQRRKRIFIHGARKDLNMIPVFPTPTHYDPDKEKGFKKNQISPALIRNHCFAINGFPKEEVKDLYWNSVLNIQMNKKTAAQVLDNAVIRFIADNIARKKQRKK